MIGRDGLGQVEEYICREEISGIPRKDIRATAYNVF